MTSAGARALLVAMLILMPTLVLPGITPDTAQMAALLALLGSILTFTEYFGVYPSVIEFRNAPPFNRLRFGCLFLTVLLLTVIADGIYRPSLTVEIVTGIGARVGQALDFPFSPVRLMLITQPDTTSPGTLGLMRTSAGIAYLVSLSTIAIFAALVQLLNWPIRRQAFNFWINLPLFDPTTGGDVLARLKRDGQINVALGFLLPFLLPAVLQIAARWTGPVPMNDPHVVIWTISAWAFLPASLIMRGIALMRIASLIEEKRRRAYAQSDGLPAF